MTFITIYLIGALFTLGLEYSQQKRKGEEYTKLDVAFTVVAWAAVLGGIVDYYLNKED